MSDDGIIDLPTCCNCSKLLNIEQSSKIGKHEECPHCYAPVHCCRMCKYYDRAAYNECHEPMAERVIDKEKANFCDYYEFGNGTVNGQKELQNQISTADALFKK